MFVCIGDEKIMCDMKLLWMCRIPQYDKTQCMDISHPIYLETQEKVDVWMNKDKYDNRSATAFWMCADATASDVLATCDDCRDRMATQVMGAAGKR